MQGISEGVESRSTRNEGETIVSAKFSLFSFVLLFPNVFFLFPFPLPDEYNKIKNPEEQRGKAEGKAKVIGEVLLLSSIGRSCSFSQPHNAKSGKEKRKRKRLKELK